MTTTVNYTDLFKNAAGWGKHISADIDTDMAEDATLVNTSTGSAVMTVMAPAKLGAAEFARIIEPPRLGPVLLKFWKYGFRYRIPAASYELLVDGGRHENDVKFCFEAAPADGSSIANIANISVQRNYSNGGMWEVSDVTGGWAPTGIKPPLPAPDVWHTVEHSFTIDWTGKTASVFSLTEDGKTYVVPMAQQIVTFNVSNWGLAIALQAQLKTAAAGAVQVEYDGGYLMGSDEAF